MPILRNTQHTNSSIFAKLAKILPVSVAIFLGSANIMAENTAKTEDLKMQNESTSTINDKSKIHQILSDWEKPSQKALKQALSPLAYDVTQKEGTEPPFKNAYWDNKEPGIYVDIVSGEPLFASIHKYKSGTGWPSFWQPLEPQYITEHEDRKLWMRRVEVRSKFADSHLGHVFNDGPAPTGLRYCINSAALEFIPLSEMADKGYGQYVSLFEK